MIANICDRCGVVIPKDEDSSYYLISITPVENGYTRSSRKIVRDLCPKCAERIRMEVEKNNDRRDEKISISAGSEEDPVD